MISFIVFVTIVFLVKLLIDYVYTKSGIVNVAGIKGFMIGFDIEEVVMDYEDPETHEVIDVLQTTIEISLCFVSILLMYQEDLSEDDNYAL